MRSRILPAVGVSALALVAAAAFAPGASASHSGVGLAHKASASSLVHFHPAALGCHKQLANDGGSGIVSQNFEASYDFYDSQGADDFKIATGGCTVSKVKVNGVYSNSIGPAASLHVTFYKNNAGVPGGVKSDQDGLGYTDPSGTGNFTIPITPVSLLAHKYWVSVQVNMDFATGGYWFWNTNITQKGLASVWRNPGDGFGTGCTTYTTTTVCIPAGGEGPDFAYALLQ